MKPIRNIFISASIAVFSVTSAFSASLTNAEHTAGKNKIAADYKFDISSCNALRANARDICNAQAKGRESDAKAELKYAFSGNETDANKMRTVKADSIFAVAKERCDDRTGNDKDVCRAEAKRDHTDALAENKMIKKVGAAETKNADTKRDEDYKVAVEKCDAMSGDAKENCVRVAKLQAKRY